MDELRELQKDLPQLIVALDSLDESANYIHIKDAKEDTIYYCPCCKGVIKPRAYKDDKEYKYQAHYYHYGEGGCNDETFMHYICKMWLFESGCKFKANNQIYTVNKIETEKTFHTEFGDYRPDITVYTKENKIFFFEIKNTNKKTENYIPKWDELENDVIEVDVRYFINQKVDSNTPEFKLIYSDGECFIKTYTRKDYDDLIAKRKLEWKRQDKLNYKIMWEKLDWFWIELQKYKNGESNNDDILKYFSSLSFYDIGDCYKIISKMSCLKGIKDRFRCITNNIVINYIEDQVSSLTCEKGISEYTVIFSARKNLSVKWVISDSYDNEKKYHFVFMKENKKLVLSPEFAVGFVNNTNIKINESILDSTKFSEQTKVDSMIKNSIKTNKNISIKEKYKIEIDKLSKDITDKRWCKLISDFIYKKTNVKFNVYVNNDYIFIESDFIKIKFGTFNDWDFTPKFIKDKCNEIIYSIKNIDFSKTNYCQFDFYDYKNLTSTIKDRKSINDSTISVNKVLVANKILNDDKISFTDEYGWMIKNKICKEYYNHYYSYTSLLWNEVGGIWLNQNWENLNEQYKKMQSAYKKALKYFNSLIKEYPTVKIVKSNLWSDYYVLNLDLIGQSGDCVRLIEICKDTYDFKIGHDYEDNILNFNYEKAKKSMKKFLKWYLYEKERENIRLFNVQKEELNAKQTIIH